MLYFGATAEFSRPTVTSRLSMADAPSGLGGTRFQDDREHRQNQAQPGQIVGVLMVVATGVLVIVVLVPVVVLLAGTFALAPTCDVGEIAPRRPEKTDTP